MPFYPGQNPMPMRGEPPLFSFPGQQSRIPQIIQQMQMASKKGPGGSAKKDMIYGLIANSLGGLPFVGGLVGQGGLGRLFQSKQAGGLGFLNR
jgi:hypothetical protein